MDESISNLKQPVATKRIETRGRNFFEQKSKSEQKIYIENCSPHTEPIQRDVTNCFLHHFNACDKGLIFFSNSFVC